MKNSKQGILALASLWLVACGGGGSSDNSGGNPGDLLAPTISSVVIAGTVATVTWSPLSGADGYNLYYAQEPIPDVNEYAALSGGTLVLNVTSPHEESGFSGSVEYVFRLTATRDGVEGPASAPVTASTLIAGRYRVIHGGSVVVDTVTNLEWERCSVGQTWNAETEQCQGTGNTYFRNDTFALESDGWLVPTKLEKRSLIYCSNTGQFDSNGTDDKCSGNIPADWDFPTIWEEAFPNTPGGSFWTRDPSLGNPAGAGFVVSTFVGEAIERFYNENYYVRRVRVHVPD